MSRSVLANHRSCLRVGLARFVREFRNSIERAVILCDGGLITSEHLPFAVGHAVPVAAPVPSVDDALVFPESGVKFDAIERDLLSKALAKAQNNKSQAAKLLGLPRSRLYSLLKRYGLSDARR